MKVQYTVPTSFGTVTRTSARQYSHIIVARKTRESVIRKRHADTIKNQESQLATAQDFLAKGKTYTDKLEWLRDLQTRYGGTFNQEQFEADLAKWTANFTEWSVGFTKFIETADESLAKWLAENAARTGVIEYAFAGRADLAQKRAADYRESYAEVEVIAITPEMVREIKPRGKKAVSA